jgi:hypothetical protein
MRRGQPRLIVSGESASAAGHQNHYVVLLSVGFSTRSTRNGAACLRCNTRNAVAAASVGLLRRAA